MSLSENIKSIINSITDTMDKETLASQPETAEKFKALYDKGSKDYFDILQMIHTDMATLTTAFIPIANDNHEEILECIANGLYIHFLERYMEKEEGSNFSYDKASFIQSQTFKAIVKGQNLPLDCNYQDPMKAAYYSPSTLKDTNSAIALFTKWYHLKD